jgi:GNAT superfamily N-acetyltransferase
MLAANAAGLEGMADAMMAFHRAYAGLPSSKIHTQLDCFAFQTAIDFPVFNGIPLQRFSPESADRRIEEVKKLFGDRAFSWMVLPGAQPSDVAERLARSGSEQVAVLRGMTMDLTDLATPGDAPSAVTIERVNDEDGVRDYARVFPELFHAPTESWIDQIIEAELTLFRSADDPFHRWVAYENRQALAAGMTMKLGNVAVLQTLSTLERARNRGIGQALATLALREEQKNGCTAAIVWSSPDAGPLYHRMGFLEKATAQVFVG